MPKPSIHPLSREKNHRTSPKSIGTFLLSIALPLGFPDRNSEEQMVGMVATSRVDKAANILVSMRSSHDAAAKMERLRQFKVILLHMDSCHSSLLHEFVPVLAHLRVEQPIPVRRLLAEYGNIQNFGSTLPRATLAVLGLVPDSQNSVPVLPTKSQTTDATISVADAGTEVTQDSTAVS